MIRFLLSQNAVLGLTVVLLGAGSESAQAAGPAGLGGGAHMASFGGGGYGRYGGYGGYGRYGYGGYGGYGGWGWGWGGFGWGLGLGLGLGYDYPYYGYGYGYGYPAYPYPYPYPYSGYPYAAGPAYPNATGSGYPYAAGSTPPSDLPTIPVAPIAGASAISQTPVPIPVGPDSEVTLVVRTQPNAVIWINGVKTTQTGVRREFVSAGLAPGRNYTFDLRAQWTGPDGRVQEAYKRLPVQAGERRTVDFTQPTEVAPAQYGQR